MSGVGDRRAALAAGQGLVENVSAAAGRVGDLQDRRDRQTMAMVAALREAMESTRMKRAIKISHLICISFVCIAPVLLFWNVALGG